MKRMTSVMHKWMPLLLVTSLLMSTLFAAAPLHYVQAAPTNTTELTLSFTGLEDLGAGWAYEGWVMVNGAPVSSGTFTVDSSGTMSQNVFNISAALANVSTFILTIEPSPDPDPAPSDTHVIAGDFTGGVANLSAAHGAALSDSFATAMGDFMLAAPTTDNSDGATHENGIWWVDMTQPGAALDLPELPAGWVYEGWVVGSGGPVSTGIFTDTMMADSDGAGPTAGAMMNAHPGFPGQDFINPLDDLVGQTAVVSIEPYPDNSPAPFAFKPLMGAIADASAPTVQMMNNNAANFITGSTIITDTPMISITASFSGLEDLGAGWAYEGWVIENGMPVSAGTFTVDGAGNPSTTMFMAAANEADVTDFVLTIEPSPDPDPAPADTHVVAGSITAGMANLTAGHPAALGDDFTTAMGDFILAAPTGATDGSDGATYKNGIWWVDMNVSPAEASLDLPTLPPGWVYEGWVVGGGGPVSTGTFTDTMMVDSDGAGLTAGVMMTAHPPFPGQDFINPLDDLVGQTAVISIEPDPDNSPAPFAFKPLVGSVMDIAMPTLQPMMNNAASFITGTIMIDAVATIEVNNTFTGLEDLGAGWAYEGWIIEDGMAVSAGVFTVDAAGVPSMSSFMIEADESLVSTFVLTIEPSPDPDPAPAATHVVAGDFNSGMAALDAAHGAALGDDFTSASGGFILAAPTTDGTDGATYKNGIWWLTPVVPQPSLDLPVLPAGWKYEGWVVDSSTGPVSTGTFTDVMMMDSDGAGSTAGAMSSAHPPYPGQDFINPLTSLVGQTAVISIEPDPDNSAAPFAFKPLVGDIMNVAGPTLQPMMNNSASFITGTAMIESTGTVEINANFTGLEDLGPGWVYEGWVIENGMPVSAGTFTVDFLGNPSTDTFVAQADVAAVTTFVVTIEPSPDPNPAPADTHILAGDINNGSAILTIDHMAAIGDNFATASGEYILAAPTADSSQGADYFNGIWWLDMAGPTATLDLPTLPAGWMYEGWVVGANGPVSTGTFTDGMMIDSDGAGMTAGSMMTAHPPFPGQDFVSPLTDLRGMQAVISVEPYPDNSPAPFTLKPLVDMSIDDVGMGVLQVMGNNSAGAPYGSVTFNEQVYLNLDCSNLDDLGIGWVYEGWVMDGGNPVSTGRFTANADGTSSHNNFMAQVTSISNVGAVVISVEPASDPDPNPNDIKIIGGDFVNNMATATAAHPAALGVDLSTATGSYILAAPSGDPANDGSDYFNGIWWLDMAGPTATLDLPTLPSGWVYEGWVVVNGAPISTGTFTDTMMADSDSGGATAGINGTPPFPGQDFVTNLVDLRGGMAVISIEPSPDNSPAPFGFKPLVDMDIEDLGMGVLQTMTNNAAGFATCSAELFSPAVTNITLNSVQTSTLPSWGTVALFSFGMLGLTVVMARKRNDNNA